MSGRLFTVSGPAGAGKGTLVKLALAQDPSLFLSISCTTREVRPGEREDVDYHYIAEAEFDRMVRENAFYEWASVHGHRYGTPCAPVEAALREGRSAILEIDVQGSAQVLLRRPDVVRVFVLPPDWATLRRRLVERQRDKMDDVEKRMRNAQGEVREALNFDYAIENGNREEAAAALMQVIRGEPGAEAFALVNQKERVLRLIQASQ